LAVIIGVMFGSLGGLLAIAAVATEDDEGSPGAGAYSLHRGWIARTLEGAVAEVCAVAEAPPPEAAEGPGPGARTDRPPADPEALGAWLVGGGYLDWAPQSAVHPTDEHGGARVLFNPLLAASFAAGAQSHPVGAAAVRELYAPDLVTPKGLAMMVKIDPKATDEAGWFWYEIFSFDADAQPTVAQLDAPGCLGCHAAGVDLVMPPEA